MSGLGFVERRIGRGSRLSRACCALRCLQDNREAAERLLTNGEQLLGEWKHPDPLVRE